MGQYKIGLESLEPTFRSLVTAQGSFRQLWRLGIPGYSNYFNCESSQPTISQEDFRFPKCISKHFESTVLISYAVYIFVKIVLKEHLHLPDLSEVDLRVQKLMEVEGLEDLLKVT